MAPSSVVPRWSPRVSSKSSATVPPSNFFGIRRKRPKFIRGRREKFPAPPFVFRQEAAGMLVGGADFILVFCQIQCDGLRVKRGGGFQPPCPPRPTDPHLALWLCAVTLFLTKSLDDKIIS